MEATVLKLYEYLNQDKNELHTFTLSDKSEINVTGKKPDKFELFNKIYSSKSWRNLYTKVVEKTYELHQDIFLKHIERNSFNTNKNLLSTNIHDMGNLSYEKIDNFYLNTNLSAIQILSNLSTIFELLSIDEDELIINLNI